MTKTHLSNRLRVFRADRGFTQWETADLAHVSRYRFWRIEKGDLEPTDEERRAIARVFGVPVAELFPGVAA